MTRRLLIALLLLALAAPVARARDLTVYCEYPPPKEFVLGDKGGLIYDQVRELMRRTDVATPIRTVTWKRGYDEATTRVDDGLFPTTRTKEREDLFHWVGPILRLEWVFYAHADSGIVIESLEDARKVKTIGTYAKDGKEQWLQAHGFTNLDPVMDNVTNLRKLYDRRIDLMVGSPSVTDRWPEMFHMDPTKLKPVYTFNTVDLYLALSRDTAPDTVHALRLAFEDMLLDGTVKRFYATWVPGLNPPLSSFAEKK